MTSKVPTKIIISALREIAINGLRTEEGVIEAAILEGAERMEELDAAIRKTLSENAHLADGDNCTLIDLKRVVKC